MPPPSPKIDPSDGPARGCRSAWVSEAWLLPVLLPVLALNLIGSLALDLSTGADHLVIVDGGVIVTEAAGPVSWLRLGWTVATWLLAVTAGAVAAVGARRGQTVDPRTAVLVALGRRALR